MNYALNCQSCANKFDQSPTLVLGCKNIPRFGAYKSYSKPFMSF